MIYDIEWYPSFLIIKDSNMVKVGEMSVDEVKEILKEQIGGNANEY